MRQTTWIYQKEKYHINSENGMDANIYSILQDRNLSYEEHFSSDPFSLQDIEKAVLILQEAKAKQEKIWIYGDYDVDGITSVSLCYLALKELGYTVEYYIPLRDEGYGLNKEALQSIYDMGGRIIISVDCGITSIEEVDFANSLGIQMIITDHHEMREELPLGAAVINPKRKENNYDFPSLAGVGTAFFLIAALFESAKKRELLEKYLDIVAIGTVADIVPLVHDNRLLVKQGLNILAKSKWTGLRLLVKRLFPDYETRKFSASDIGFMIAPIFNAAGRLEDAKNSVKLFLEEDIQQANLQIDTLIANNSERRRVQEHIFQTCLKEIKEKKLENRNVIVIANENFHHGVIGIVASKLVDQFYRPSIVMEIKKEEGIATASCRSISGVNIVSALKHVSSLLLRYGGHAGAAGFSIDIENIPLFYEKLDAYLATIYTQELLSKKIHIVKELLPFQIHYPLLRDMSYLEPFGASNPAPVFSMTQCRLDRIRLIGTDKKHLMCNIVHGTHTFWNCVWFQAADMFETLLNSNFVDVAFHLKLEKYRGYYQYKIFIDDIKESHERNFLEYREELSLAQVSFPYECILYLKHKNVEEPLHLHFEGSEVKLYSKKSYLTTLDAVTSQILLYHREQGKKFSVTKKEVFLEEEHYVIHIEIALEHSFSSFALKEGELFQQIKNFLLGKEGNYNTIQKKALASFFKEKQNTFIQMQKGRGIGTIVKTLRIYADYFHKKYQVLEHYQGEDMQENLDFLILLFPQELPKENTVLTLVIAEKCIQHPHYTFFVDNYSIPKNIEWIDETDLLEYKNIFTHALSRKKQKEILHSLGEKEILYSTKDLLVHL